MAEAINGLAAKKDRKDILNELIQSLKNHNVLGVFLAGGEEMITTSVVNIEGDSTDKLIYFETTDLHGYHIDKNPVPLSAIATVIPFKTLFSDPVYQQIRQRKNQNNRAA